MENVCPLSPHKLDISLVGLYPLLDNLDDRIIVLETESHPILAENFWDESVVARLDLAYKVNLTDLNLLQYSSHEDDTIDQPQVKQQINF